MRKALTLAALLLSPSLASAAPPAACAPGASLAPAVADALNHAASFEYLRHSLLRWAAEGATICAQGVVLDKNIYQYHRVYLQLEVRRADGQLAAVAPLLFQMASIQAHHNENRRPWIAMPWSGVQEQLARAVPGEFKPVAGSLPAPTEASFAAAAKEAGLAPSIDENTFAVMDLSATLGHPGLYLATWLERVPNTGGGVFTEAYSAQALWLERGEGGTLRAARGSGYRDLLSPFDALLGREARADDGQAETRQAHLRANAGLK
jgi:hypothetical protein